MSTCCSLCAENKFDDMGQILVFIRENFWSHTQSTKYLVQFVCGDDHVHLLYVIVCALCVRI